MSVDDKKIIYSMMRVSKFYDKKPIIKDISLSYFYGAKIGVLGLNGSGKSTLLKIMAGVDTEFNGQAVLSPGYTVGYLQQEPVLDENKTVRQIVEEGCQELVDLLAEFNSITDKFSEPDADFEKLCDRQAVLQEKRVPAAREPVDLRRGKRDRPAVERTHRLWPHGGEGIRAALR